MVGVLQAIEELLYQAIEIPTVVPVASIEKLQGFIDFTLHQLKIYKVLLTSQYLN